MIRKVLIIAMMLVMGLTGVIQAQDEEPIRIGVLADLSGGLAIYGFEQVNGFKLGLLYEAGIDPTEYESVDAALEDVTIAGRPVEVLVRDYGSESLLNDPDNAAALTRELFESDFVDIIYGTPNSSAAVQVQALTGPDEFNILFMAGPAASPDLTGPTFHENTFRVCRNTLQDSLTYATIADQFGTKYAILSIDNAFGRGTAGAFEYALGLQENIEFVTETIYVPSDTVDFTPYLQQALDSGAETLIQIWAGAGGVPLTQQTIELGLLDAMNVVGGTNSNDVVVAAPLPVGSVAYIVYNYTLPDTEINDLMSEWHIQMYNDVPDLFTECSFASAQALYLALEATEGDTLTEALVPALEGLSFEGPKGDYYIRPSDHQALVPLYVIRYLGNVELEMPDGTTITVPDYELVAEVPGEETAPPCLLPEEYADRCEMDMAGDE